ncbi:MAG: response regulator [Epsilonproteobacteria bacterium]|nr:response regulator [Campylobacterota bacterium]
MTNVDLVELTLQTKKFTAMIVEDERVTNELLASNFKNFFKSVDAFLGAQEALEAYKKTQPDILFADLIMPNMDGIEFIRQIRQINPSQIIIVVSASNDIDKISASIELGVNSFIQKPIDTKKIIEMLQSVVALLKKRQKQETKIFSISLPLDIYYLVDESARAESISKNAMIIRALRQFYNL